MSIATGLLMKFKWITAVLLTISVTLSSCRDESDTVAESDTAFLPAAGAVVLALGGGVWITELIGLALASVGLGGMLYQWHQNNVHYIALTNPAPSTINQLTNRGATLVRNGKVPRTASRMSGVYWSIAAKDITTEEQATRTLDTMIRGTVNEILRTDAKQNRKDAWWLVIRDTEPFADYSSGWVYRLTISFSDFKYGKVRRYSFPTKAECEKERMKEIDRLNNWYRPRAEAEFPRNGKLVLNAWCVQLPGLPPVRPLFN
jgi:hypothetical protein